MDTVERWSGPLLLLGGAMIVVASTIHPQGGTSQFVQQSLWVPAHLIEYVAFMIILLGLVGWYSRFSTSLGRLGTLGFLISFFTTATGGGFSLVSEALLRPYLAANSPSLDDALLTDNFFIIPLGLTILGFFVGYFIFSVAVVRARVLARWGIWLIVLQIIGLASVFGLAVAYAAALIFEALLGLSIAGWGYAILSTPRLVRGSERLQVS